MRKERSFCVNSGQSSKGAKGRVIDVFKKTSSSSSTEVEKKLLSRK